MFLFFIFTSGCFLGSEYVSRIYIKKKEKTGKEEGYFPVSG
jgi:hypothetical protein